MDYKIKRLALFSDAVARLVTEYSDDFDHATAVIAFAGISAARGFDGELSDYLKPFMEKKLERDINEANQMLNN